MAFGATAIYIILVLLALVICLYLYFTRHFNYWKKHGIPYVKPLPFFGNLKDAFLQKYYAGLVLQDIYKEYKHEPYVGIFAFDRPALLVNDLDLIKNIMVKDAHHFVDHHLLIDEKVDPIWSNIIFSLKGERWKHTRNKLSPTFSSGKMKMMFNLVDNCSKNLSNVLEKISADELRLIGLKETLARFTTDSISTCSLGIDSNSLSNPDSEVRQYMRKVFEFSVFKGVGTTLMFFMPTFLKTMKMKEQNGVVRRDLLDSMMEIRKNGMEISGEGNVDFDGDMFVAQAFNIFIGGFETSSSATTFMLYELSKHPEAQNRLREEISQVLQKHNNQVTYEAIQEMKYMDMVVNETLRKYPVLGFLDRVCSRDYDLSIPTGKGVFTIKAGMSVYIPLQGIHNNPDYFPDPEKFDPERFNEENKLNRHNFAHIPFGEGPRICIGKSGRPTSRLPTGSVQRPTFVLYNYAETMSLLGSLTIDLLVLLLFLINVAYFYFTRNFNFWRDLGVKSVKPVPYLGSIKDVALRKVSVGFFLYDVYKKYRSEPCVGIYSFNKPVLVAIDNELVKKVLVKDAQVFLDRTLRLDEKKDPLGAKNLFMMRGEKWKHMRNNLSPTFTSGKMKNMFYLMEACAKELDNYLDNATADGSPVEVKETMARFTTDVIASCAFGIDSNSLKNPNSEFRAELRKVFETTPLKAIRGLLSIFFPLLLKVITIKAIDDNTMNFVRNTLWNTAKEKHEILRNDFLDNLRELRNKVKNDKEGPLSKLEDDDYAAQAFSFLLAGFETSSTTMSFTLYELALHPEIQNKLREEISQVLQKHNNQVTYEAIQEMKYLDMVVNETLRKYPPLPFLDRKSATNCEFPAPTGRGTITIPAGTGIYIPLLGLHYDPKYYPEPDKFDPERFTDENKRNRPGYTYMPFGEGPRLCIGMRFGLMQTKIGLIHMLTRYELEPCKETKIPLVLNKKAFMLQSVGGIPLSFNKVA
ncbi:hypothetical protein L9F63_014390 [Diploptera punctata]|uniref:Cytochrome P450 n=1 Tax=Diploptera punctata TaxID=6984 RepID=A0AAD8A817_DIPPU|nr:hypothetical protein L9F63_014390 [Diploptera punctata]